MLELWHLFDILDTFIWQSEDIPIKWPNFDRFFPFWRTQVLFMGPLIPLFWLSGDICPWFQSQGGSLFACFVAGVILRFTSGATPADCKDFSMYLQTCPLSQFDILHLFKTVCLSKNTCRHHNGSFSLTVCFQRNLSHISKAKNKTLCLPCM